MLTGIDLSHWNTIADYNSLQQSGLAFAYIKATQGDQIVDPAMVRHYHGISPTHILTGFYHFYVVGADPLAQAAHFCAAIKPYMNPYALPPALDIEDETHLIPVETLIKDIQIFLDKVKELTGYLSMFYSNKSFIMNRLGGTRQFSDYPLWLACYEPKPATPFAGWNTPKIWQHTDKSRNAGVPTDGDIWYGDAVDLLSCTKASTFKDGTGAAEWVAKYHIKILGTEA